MSTIEINQTFETAVKTMLNKHATDAVSVLADKYGFSLEEALEHLDLGSSRVSKKEKAEKGTAKADRPAQSKAKSAPKGKGKASEEPKEKKPRKPSGYQAFMKSERESVKEHLTEMTMSDLQEELGLEEEPEKFHPKHVMAALGQRWKALSEEERAEWVEQASSGGEEE